MRMSTSGTCLLCGKASNRVGMTRHLNGCAPVFDSSSGHRVEVFRIRVDGGADLPYWIDVEVKAEGKLALLDTFLRKTWGTCEGSRGRFILTRGDVYTNHPRRTMGEQSLQTPMSEAFSWLRGWFSYQCGDDSAASLRMRVTHRRLGRLGRPGVRLVARNEPHVWPCAVCGEPATKACADDRAYLCAAHAREHSCRKQALHPIVDSPVMASLLRTREKHA